MPKEDGYKNLVPFKKGQSGSPGGKPKFYTLLKKMVKASDSDMSLSKNDLRQTVALLLDQPIEKLKSIAEDKEKSPAMLVYLCSVIRKSIVTGRIDFMKELFATIFPNDGEDKNNQVINFVAGFDVPTEEDIERANKESEEEDAGESVDNE